MISLEKLDIDTWYLKPIFYVKKGDPIFTSIEQMITLTEMKNISLGNVALEYESKVLELDREEILKEMKRRINIMFSSIENGFEKNQSKMKILEHSASIIYKNEQNGRLFSNSVNTTCAIRALSAMDVVSSGGIICAAPTGGSAGVFDFSKEFSWNSDAEFTFPVQFSLNYFFFPYMSNYHYSYNTYYCYSTYNRNYNNQFERKYFNTCFNTCIIYEDISFTIFLFNAFTISN
ncbi:unnamed protein product [marine sediment metagenome]|uniref:Serine dehydratase-like alpha subunit domain-containing protein n=1 Tax=marine sediment metagenome TaxID=412755 RepID=X1AQ06_9ZZZZ